jgi:hypothetical protein
MTMPIGGGDMPVVISLLNSLSGVAAALAGFIILNNVLVVAGCLVGAAESSSPMIMCKAMNRSLGNVLFSGFGATAQAAGEVGGEMKPRPWMTPTSCSRPRKAWSSSPATAWPSPRPSTPSRNSPICSKTTARKSASPSTRSPAACPAT